MPNRREFILALVKAGALCAVNPFALVADAAPVVALPVALPLAEKMLVKTTFMGINPAQAIHIILTKSYGLSPDDIIIESFKKMDKYCKEKGLNTVDFYHNRPMEDNLTDLCKVLDINLWCEQGKFSLRFSKERSDLVTQKIAEIL